MKRGLFGFFFILIPGIALIFGCNESMAGQADVGKTSLKQETPAAAPSPGPAPAGPAKPAETKEPKKEDKKSIDGPKILVTKEFHDFGDIGPGTYHSCTFTFKNIGNKTLKIDHVQSTCGCSVPQLEKKDYEPGESGTIEVRFHAPTTSGETKKQMYIVSNDPSNPRAQLEVRAVVDVKVQTEPTEVSLVLNKPNAGLGPIQIKSTDGKPFRITKFSSMADAITCVFDPNAAATEFTLTPQVDMDLLSKNPTGVMTIEVDHPQGGIQMVRYNALPRYEINRPRIILQNVKPGQKEQKEVVITSHYGESLKIASSSSRAGLMKIVKQEVKDNALTLTIEITAPEKEAANRRYFSDELMIRFDNSAEVEVRISGWFAN
ncbi:MAG: DUF1573 domain-containing protein [Anaerohalosphaeraceae bacterium]